MNHSVPHLICLLFVFMMGCAQKPEPHVVTLAVQAPDSEPVEFYVTNRNLLNLEWEHIASGKLDTLGTGMLTFSIPEETFAILKIDRKEYPLYLQPGDDLRVVFDEVADKVTWSGIGAEVNNYLFESSVIRQQMERGSGKSVFDLDGKDALLRMDTIDLALKSHLNNFVDSLQIPPNIASQLEWKLKLRTLQAKQAMGFNFSAQHDSEIPAILDTEKEIPYDTALLKMGLNEYAYLNDIAMVIKNRALQRDSVPDHQKPYVIRREVELANHEIAVEEFLLAKNIDFWISNVGVSPSIDSLYFQFRQKFPSSRYLNALQKNYDSWMAIQPGHLAPEIRGITLQGDTVTSTDLREKILYIDVWASWCGPCIEEIPFSMRLQSKFRNDDRVVFLNVSVDDDQGSWKGATDENKDWRGVHILNDLSIYKAYKIRGIPRYILIDQGGRIVNSDAPRPSQDVESEIMKLLRE